MTAIAQIILGLGEDAEPAAHRIVARTDAPLVVDLEVGGSAFVAHAGLPDLFAGTPALIPLTLRGARSARLHASETALPSGLPDSARCVGPFRVDGVARRRELRARCGRWLKPN
jgi:hypothetical protein